MGESMLSVVSPDFNEARNLPAVYEKIRSQTIHFVAEHDAHRKTRLPVEQIHRVNARLHRRDLIPPRANSFHHRPGIPGMLPWHRGLRPERRLGNRLLRWPRCDPAQIQLLYAGRVRRAEERPHVVHAPHVVQQHRRGQGPYALVECAGCSCLKRNAIHPSDEV